MQNKGKRAFVSRAGRKLQYALYTFKIDVKGKVCIDFGCNVGGFTDCLLQNGARKVYAVDTGYGVLDWNLRQNSKVIVMERTNALHAEFDEAVDFISIDVGWTKQRLIIPKAIELLREDSDIVSLLKPHYEAEKSWLREGKLMEEFIPEVQKKVKEDLSKLDIIIDDIVESPLVGQKGGNREFLLWIRKN